MVKDPISNLISGIKNASSRKKSYVEAPFSKLLFSIADLLKKEGFVGDVERVGQNKDAKIKISLKYDEDGKPVVNDVKRVSKFSKRVYLNYKDIRPVRNGYGILVLSTPKGIVSGAMAKKANIGGEALFEIW